VVPAAPNLSAKAGPDPNHPNIRITNVKKITQFALLKLARPGLRSLQRRHGAAYADMRRGILPEAGHPAHPSGHQARRPTSE